MPTTPTAVTATESTSTASFAVEVEVVDGDTLVLERSVDGGTTWSAVRQALGVELTGSPETVTVTDYEAPTRGTVTYRARVSDGTESANATSGAVTITVGGWWLRAPAVPGMNRRLVVTDGELIRRYARQGGTLVPLRGGFPVTFAGPQRLAEVEPPAIELRGNAALKALLALTGSARTLQLACDTGETYYCSAPLELEVTEVNTVDRATNPLRLARLPLTPVREP